MFRVFQLSFAFELNPLNFCTFLLADLNKLFIQQPPASFNFPPSLELILFLLPQLSFLI